MNLQEALPTSEVKNGAPLLMPNKHFPTKVKVRIPRIRPPESASIDDSNRNFDIIDSNIGDLVPWGASNNHSMLAKPKVSVIVVDK
jgi:hypothetical protein